MDLTDKLNALAAKVERTCGSEDEYCTECAFLRDYIVELIGLLMDEQTQEDTT